MPERLVLGRRQEDEESRHSLHPCDNNPLRCWLQSSEEDRLREMITAASRTPSWMPEARAGLKTLLQAKLDPTLRQAVLTVISKLAALGPPTWLRVRPPPPKFLIKHLHD